MRRLALILWMTAWGVLVSSRADVLQGEPEWKIDFGEPVVGHPVLIGKVEATTGILVTLRSGKVVVINPAGEKRQTIALDLPCETPGVAGNLRDDGIHSIVAVDVRGSVYCFNERGDRLWKFPRAVKSGEFRLPVLADLDGDGKLEILVTDSYGTLQALDAMGRLRLEIVATQYRFGVPAVGDVTGDGRPEIIFGTEAGEVYCLDVSGEVIWSTTLNGCFGRAVPLIADTDKNGKHEVFFPTAFNNARPGLFALEAATGKFLWKAPSLLQSYRSTVVADLDGDGKNEILFGDKNSSLFCVDPGGQRLWSTQLPGRGIFFAPAVADLDGSGSGTVFAIVRNAGSNGKSLYAVDAKGQILDALSLPGGGASSPALCRFTGQTELRLLALSGGGQLLCYRTDQKSAGAKILWPGIRNDLANSGFVQSSHPQPPRATLRDVRSVVPAVRRQALAGINPLPLTQNIPGAELVSVKTVAPDKSIRVALVRLISGLNQSNALFDAFTPGEYEVTVQWHQTGHDRRLRSERYLYELEPAFKADGERFEQVRSELKRLGAETHAAASLADFFQSSALAKFEHLRETGKSSGLEALRKWCDYALALVGYGRDKKWVGDALVHQLTNPWENFDPITFFNTVTNAANSIAVGMLGNSYESAAIALTNLKTNHTSFRLSCGNFEAGTNKVAAASVLQVRDVVSVRPDGTGPLTEDPLPLLGEGQIVKLEPGETRKVWLTFRSQALAADKYKATLKIGDIASTNSPLDIPVTLEVSPVRLPERFTYRECNWLYLNSINDEALQDATMNDALEHRMNVFVIPSVSVPVDEQGNLLNPNTSATDKLILKLRGRAFFLISGAISVQWPADARPGEELRDQTFARAVRWYAEHMRSLGCDYDDYAIYLHDEPGLLGHDAGFDEWVALVKRCKAADPRMQLYANPAGGARAELLRPVQDLIDVWAPDLHLVREQPEELKELFQRAKHYWHYEAPGDQRALDPLGFYRMKPWVAFQQGMTGGGYWVYSSSEFWSDNPGAGTEYGTVYLTDKGPVTTRRWEASREGIQDFELLWLLRKTAEKSRTPDRQAAFDLVGEAVKFVTQGQEAVTDISRHVRPYTPDYARWMDYRRQLIQMQLRLTN